MVQIDEGRRRVVVADVQPEIDGGRFPIKRVVGEQVVVEADAFTDGHDVVVCALCYRKGGDAAWREAPMRSLGNDRWQGAFVVAEVGRYTYTVRAWVDRFKTWARDLAKRLEAGQNVAVELLIGAALAEQAIPGAPQKDATRLRAAAELLRAGGDLGVREALSDKLAALMSRYPDRHLATTYGTELAVVVDRERARFSAWYELFPRSCAAESRQHGTFRDVEEQLPYVAAMGFDVLYLPPIHPIGRTYRKGRNNTITAEPHDPGSPWAIGAREGGHTAIHHALGTLNDFRRLLARAEQHGIELALDIAFQASPDHPYVREHRAWFRARPDGTIQYAENPPKKYQDIYPFDFESEAWRELWEELASVVRFWCEQGVRIFRVDNPHTKPFAFWEWLLDAIKRDYPETIFLAEAFTRPKVMYQLAKLGFTQSYNYFPWRNTRWEIAQFMTELTQTPLCEFFRPNLWPNTPDILPEYLQLGGRSGFMVRVALASTLGASYGIYGPAFELCEDQPIASGKEEYFNSEKYEIKRWQIDRPDSLKEFIARLNRIRIENPALHSNAGLRFHPVDNEHLIAYTKATEHLENIILTVVNLDPHHTQGGQIELPLEPLGIDSRHPFQVHDLLGGARYLWNGPRNYLELDPRGSPVAVFRVRWRIRTEQDFDYYL
jgi:starch synthase (maltosyl-transferring)